MILLGIILFLTVLEAVHEGLALRGKGNLAGKVEMFKLAGIVAIILWALATDKHQLYQDNGFWYMIWHLAVPLIIGWAFIRYAIFDFIYNACAGLPLTYIGKTKDFDLWFAKITRKQEPKFFFWWTRPIFLLTGLSVILRYVAGLAI